MYICIFWPLQYECGGGCPSIFSRLNEINMGRSGILEEYKPVLAMLLAQSVYAAMALTAKETLSQGMKPMVFVVYRQAVGTVVLAITSILAKGGILRQMSFNFRAFGLVVVATLSGCTLNQYFYYQGLSMASSSMATAMTNTVPAVTFVMAATVGLERIRCDLRSMAKVLGTIICVGGAFCITFFRGSRLLNTSSQKLILLFGSTSENWVVGSLFLIACSCCWSFQLIMQSSICRQYTDALSLSTLMCFLATLMSAALTFCLEESLSDWKITSLFQLFSCLFAGVFGSAVSFYLQSWCIAVRGPLFSALFNPLCTLITTVLASIVLREKLYVGGLVGAVAIVSGLYIVLWGKAQDFEAKNKPLPTINSEKVNTTDRKQSDEDLSRPLIAERENNV